MAKPYEPRDQLLHHGRCLVYIRAYLDVLYQRFAESRLHKYCSKHYLTYIYIDRLIDLERE